MVQNGGSSVLRHPRLSGFRFRECGWVYGVSGQISWERMFPLGQELILLVPAGDLNPNRSLWGCQNDTSPPLVSPEIIPVIELPFQPFSLQKGTFLYRGGKNRNHPIEPGLRAFIIRYPRSRVRRDPEGGEAWAPFLISWEGRNISVSCRIPTYSMSRGGGKQIR